VKDRDKTHRITGVILINNTRKATFNRVGTQRKKRGYKGGASYTYAKVRWCQNTRLAVLSMKVESNDYLEFWGADAVIAMLM
jgi:hypothetical protein